MSEILFEYIRQGAYVKVTAIEPEFCAKKPKNNKSPAKKKRGFLSRHECQRNELCELSGLQLANRSRPSPGVWISVKKLR